MARARNIKHGFFTNDQLAEMPALGRLLFIGLWTIADREGRLEDRPKKIKAEVLPYDECNVDDLLTELHERGFITRYAVEDKAFIQINNFSKHQNPHVKEAASTIPAPCKPDTSAIQAEKSTKRATLIPDSGFLIPDSIEKHGAAAPIDCADATPTKPDFVAQVFSDGVSLLVASGEKESDARSLLGKLRKKHGDDGALRIITAARGASSPREYIAATFRAKGSVLNL